MITLALDASTYAGSVARAATDATCSPSATVAMRGREHEALMPAVAEAAGRARASTATRSSAWSVAPGPGASRACASRARSRRGSRWRRCVRCVPVSSLALVVGAREPCAPGRYLAAIDALRGEHYVGAVRGRTDGGSRARARTRARACHRARCSNARPRTTRVAVGPGVSGASHVVRARAPPPGSTDALDATAAADLATWEPAYGRLAEAQVKWEAAHGRPLRGRYDGAASIRCRSDGPASRRRRHRGDRAGVVHRPVDATRSLRALARAHAGAGLPSRGQGSAGGDGAAGCWAMLWRWSSAPRRRSRISRCAPGAAAGNRASAARRGAAERRAAEGVAAVFLEVRESNAARATLYESRGFEAVGRRRGYYRLPARGCARAQAGVGRPEVKCHVK